MVVVGVVVVVVLWVICVVVVFGIFSLSFDEIVELVICEFGVILLFLGYYGYLVLICVLINDWVVYGILLIVEVFVFGDLVFIDCGVVLDGWYGDVVIIFGVGVLSDVDEVLLEVIRELF